ncbi:PepSY domain-containing protein [Halorussus vallis]|nr:PepSY domain-containing protein [Halorussus vallis]
MTQQQVLALVLGGIVAVSFAGGAVFGVAATASGDRHSVVGSDDSAAIQDGTTNQTTQGTQTTQAGQATTTTQAGQVNRTVPITAALNAAANATNGTPVGGSLGQQDGGLLGDGGSLVYTVDVLLDNGTHIEAQVNATNGSVVQTQQTEGFLQGIFGQDNVPDEPLNLSSYYNASEAVQLVQNQSNVDGTVTQVNLNSRDGDLVYEVQVNATGGQQTTYVVDARRDGQGIIRPPGGTTGTATTTGAGTATTTAARTTAATGG